MLTLAMGRAVRRKEEGKNKGWVFFKRSHDIGKYDLKSGVLNIPPTTSGDSFLT